MPSRSLPDHGRDLPKWINVHTTTRRVCLHYGLETNLSGIPNLRRHALRRLSTRAVYGRFGITSLTIPGGEKRIVA
jgi:hypothetical protein